jgi:hypothetical protein
MYKPANQLIANMRALKPVEAFGPLAFAQMFSGQSSPVANPIQVSKERL